ncbi:MAG TPA: hypothetical protein VNG33_07170, partial [Polyangiaceae bacterium]|nr:hypothetical protein [Polyangiaceae bacterium]
QGVPGGELTLAALRGFARARLGRVEGARDDLRVAWSLASLNVGVFLTLLAEVAAFVGEREIAEQLHARLLPLAGRDGLGGHVSVSYEGPIDRLRGLLESALGQHAAAEQKLRATLALAERRGFDAWVAQGRADLAFAFERAGRRPEARPLWQACAEMAEKCEMVGLVSLAASRLVDAPSAPVSARPAPRKAATLVMLREGELYRVELGELAVRIRATRGAELLARLIEAPNQEIHVLALASDDAGATTESNAGDDLDRSALRQYRSRLRELSQLVAEAENRADAGRLEVLRREQAALEREISRALGLGGRARQVGSTSERARVNVQRRLKDVLERIAEASPELGAWLSRSLRTGTYCSFHPSP